jgi:hypothetical protein
MMVFDILVGPQQFVAGGKSGEKCQTDKKSNPIPIYIPVDRWIHCVYGRATHFIADNEFF